MPDHVEQAVEAMNEFGWLSAPHFDRLAERFGLTPDDEDLISALIDHHWVYTLEGEYIRDYEPPPPAPLAWRLILEPEI